MRNRPAEPGDPVREREAERARTRSSRPSAYTIERMKIGRKSGFERVVVVRADEVAPREPDGLDDAALAQAVRDDEQRRDDQQEDEPHAGRQQQQVALRANPAAAPPRRRRRLGAVGGAFDSSRSSRLDLRPAVGVLELVLADVLLERELREHVGRRVDQRVVEDVLVDERLAPPCSGCRSSRSS